MCRFVGLPFSHPNYRPKKVLDPFVTNVLLISPEALLPSGKLFITDLTLLPVESLPELCCWYSRGLYYRYSETRHGHPGNSLWAFLETHCRDPWNKLQELLERSWRGMGFLEEKLRNLLEGARICGDSLRSLAGTPDPPGQGVSGE